MASVFEGFGRRWPIDGSIAGPQVLVLDGMVVVNVNGGNAGAEGRDGFRDADSHVRVTEIEADADIVKVAHFKNGGQMLGSGDLAEQIFDQEADAERAGKGAQVLERGGRKLDGARRPGIVALAEMDDEIAQAEYARRLRARA